MTKKVIIAGIGMGNSTLMTEQVINDIKNAEVIFGAERMLQSVGFLGDFAEKRQVREYLADAIVKDVVESEENRYVVLMSGDSGFYSGTKKLLKKLAEYNNSKEYDLETVVHPGISSLSYLCAAFQKDYNQVCLASIHGKKENLAYKVKTNRLTFLLTNGNGKEVAEYLCQYNLKDVTLYIGKNLSYENEELMVCKAAEYTEEGNEDTLLSILIENHNPMNQMYFYQDEDFIRGRVPMSKSFLRYQVCAMMDVGEDAVIYDIGAGTGAVSIELSKKVPEGKVYAIECNPEGIELIKTNKYKHSVDQIIEIEGTAPEAFTDLEKAGGVFIGGSKGQLFQILEALKVKKATQEIPVIMTAVTLETLQEFMKLAQDNVFRDLQIMQLSASNMEPLGKYHKLESANPIWIMKGYM